MELRLVKLMRIEKNLELNFKGNLFLLIQRFDLNFRENKKNKLLKHRQHDQQLMKFYKLNFYTMKINLF